MTLYEGNHVWWRLQALAACLCAAIEDPENGVPKVCYCGVVPGQAAVAQFAGDCAYACGMAWVRLAGLYRAKSVGVPDTTRGNCGSGIGMDIEMGILRCMSVGDEQGNLPSKAEMEEATQLQIADALVMWEAVLCCDAIETKDAIVGGYLPVGPDGGIVGGTMTIALAV